jgi:hypothetical protein
MRLPRARLVILALWSAGVGCDSSSDTTQSTETLVIPTSVAVSPHAFLGSVPCSNQEGALRSYVATLTDVTPLDPDVGAAAGTVNFTLPSSPPTPCSENIVFRYVIPGHQYKAVIDGYERYASELTPASYASDLTPDKTHSSGSRTMMLKADDTVVPARLTASCDPVTARLDTEVTFTTCSPPTDTGSVITGVRVEPRATLGLLACEGDGRITSFKVTPDDLALASFTGLGCADGVARYTEGIEPGKNYTFTVSALKLDGDELSACCSAKAQGGLVVDAICDPLTRGVLTPGACLKN